MVEEKPKYARGKHPNSLKNLNFFQKGEIHNPNGRPTKEQSVTEAARVLLREGKLSDLDHLDKKQELIVRALAIKWLKRALANHNDLNALLDRMEGKVSQPVANEGEVVIRVVYDQTD